MTSSQSPPNATTDRPRLTERQKKENHIRSEQKRREAIREGFDRLAAIVPGMEGQGRSEAVVLEATLQHMREQIAKRKELIADGRAKGIDTSQWELDVRRLRHGTPSGRALLTAMLGGDHDTVRAPAHSKRDGAGGTAGAAVSSELVYLVSVVTAARRGDTLCCICASVWLALGILRDEIRASLWFLVRGRYGKGVAVPPKSLFHSRLHGPMTA
jgi:heteromeric Ino2p/Ino4p transcription factor